MADSSLLHLQTALNERYLIKGELGHGGMATVYLAQDLKLHRPVALKVLRPELAASVGSDRFLREIEIAARLSHPHILTLHDSGEAGGHLYYAMPYVEGESLRQRLEREGQLPIADVIAIVQAVASALTYAHRHAVIHRDIKPENILLARDAASAAVHAMVADFGIARALDAAGGKRLTETGMALGTPAYMSPEQAAGGRLDGRSDIYALGCVAYEMLAGAPPFTGPTTRAVLARHAVDSVPSLHTVRSTVSRTLEAEIERALAKVPADRFHTADEFAHALTKHSSTARYRQRWSRTRIALGIGVGVVAAGTGTIMLRGSSSAVVPLAATLAVLPFTAGADTGLDRLGRDLAVTIGASLDGVGGIETADRLRIVQELDGRAVTSAEQAARIARQVGASSFLRGTLVRAGERVRLDAGLYGSEGLAPLAEGITVTAHRDSIGTLTDSTAWALLRQIWKRGEVPSPSLTAITTSSIPALRAFLDGEREIENDRWEPASLAFSSAIAADSTFWLAYFRYALAMWWNERANQVDPQIIEALRRHRDVFPDRERLLVSAWVIDSLPQEVTLLREVTRRFPDYWPGWFLLGDRLFHNGSLYGYQLNESRAALSRAVTLNPRLKPAWIHLFAFNLRNDTIESGRTLTRILDLPISAPPGSEAAEDEMFLHKIRRMHDAVARHGGGIGSEASALADSIARNWASLEGTPYRRGMTAWSMLWFGFPIAQVDLNRRVLRSGIRVRYPSNIFRGIAWGWAERGAWDSALASIHDAVKAEHGPRDPSPPTAVEEYGMAVLGAWLGVVNPEEAVSRRPAARGAITAVGDEGRQTELRANLAWLDGVLGFARGNRTALERARQDVRETRHARADRLDGSLAAFGRALAGDRATAGRELARLEWQCAIICKSDDEFVTPNIAVHRLSAATWLLEAGDTTQAARLLNWHEATDMWGVAGFFTYAVTPHAYLMLARIEEAQHRAGAARQHYDQFIRRYDSPMPGQRHLLDEAGAAIRRLSNDGGGAMDDKPGVSNSP